MIWYGFFNAEGKVIPHKKNLDVKCLSDGVLVTLIGNHEAFNGVLYVKHYSADEQCRRDVTFYEDRNTTQQFKVAFGTCGLSHVNVSTLNSLSLHVPL